MGMTAEQIIDLKAKIKSLMNKRNNPNPNNTYVSALGTYGTTNYDFTTTPEAGEHILTEHGQKTVDLLLKIQDIADVCSRL